MANLVWMAFAGICFGFQFGWLVGLGVFFILGTLNCFIYDLCARLNHLRRS